MCDISHLEVFLQPDFQITISSDMWNFALRSILVLQIFKFQGLPTPWVGHHLGYQIWILVFGQIVHFFVEGT